MAGNNQSNNGEKDELANKCQIYFKSAIDHYEDRRDDLDNRQKMLIAKIAMMERSIPMLMALNLRKAQEGGGGTCDSFDTVGQVRELMKGLSTSSADPADELVADLSMRVEHLNRETTELHDKIIKADIQLEESCMELESLELSNRELEEQIDRLESKLNSKISLESISSDDRICLAKIRQLGENEIQLKRSIRELEEKEILLRCQIEKIIEPKSRKQKRLCNVLKNDSKHHIYRSKNRKKKECQKIGKSNLRVEANKKLCENIGCNALKRMVDNTLTCDCCEKQLSPNANKLHAFKNLTPACSCQQENAKTPGINHLCNCEKFLLQESQTDIDKTQENPWCSLL